MVQIPWIWATADSSSIFPKKKLDRFILHFSSSFVNFIENATISPFCCRLSPLFVKLENCQFSEKAKKNIIQSKSISHSALLPSFSQFHQQFTSSICERRSRKRKKLLDLTVFFALLGSAHLKAACKMLLKLTPLVNFTNMQFMSSFCADFLSTKKLQTQIVSTEKLHKTLLYKKAACKMLLKLTPLVNLNNNLQAAFALISFWPKNYKPKL